jgi:hypothetical protein
MLSQWALVGVIIKPKNIAFQHKTIKTKSKNATAR